MIGQISRILLGRGANRPSPSLDNALNMMDRHPKNGINPAPESKPRTRFDSGLPIEEMTMANLKPKQRLQAISKAGPLLFNMYRGSRMYDDDFEPTKSKASPEFIENLEQMARGAGAVDIRYVEVPQTAIFQGKKLPAKYAIIFTVEMDKEPIDTSPSWESQHEVMRGYKNMAVISMKLAQHLRRNGFAAYPGTALGGITDYVYLAELAGLGAIGYHGLLISPGEGARLRINTIYTNIENLPLSQPEDNEHLWVRDFCAMCRKCVRSCPVDAIYQEPQPRGDGGYQTIDHDSCRTYFSKNFGLCDLLEGLSIQSGRIRHCARTFQGQPGRATVQHHSN
jgi:epoxyqueuosine reductase